MTREPGEPNFGDTSEDAPVEPELQLEKEIGEGEFNYEEENKKIEAERDRRMELLNKVKQEFIEGLNMDERNKADGKEITFKGLEERKIKGTLRKDLSEFIQTFKDKSFEINSQAIKDLNVLESKRKEEDIKKIQEIKKSIEAI